MTRKAAHCAAALIAFTCVSIGALAHSPSDSFLRVDVFGDTLATEWHVAIRDLDRVMPLDANEDGKVTWGELRRESSAVEAYISESLKYSMDETGCAHGNLSTRVDQKDDGGYAVFNFRSVCVHPTDTLTLHYTLLRGVDPRHKGILRIRAEGKETSGVLSSDNEQFVFSANSPRSFGILGFIRLGVHHILTGLDHILFIFCLVFYEVFVKRNNTRFAGRERPSIVAWFAIDRELVLLITTFTLAHTCSLFAASYQLLTLPSRLVESVIALSVAVVALENLFGLMKRWKLVLVFLFGLLHGVGFSSVVSNLDLTNRGELAAIAAFNVGIEVGQIALVLALLPVLRLMGRWSPPDSRLGYVTSCLVLILASLWLIERAFDFSII